MAQPDISKVNPELALKAVEKAKDRGSLYSQYIIFHYRATGGLAPGCDAKDLYAWIDQSDEVPEEFKVVR